MHERTWGILFKSRYTNVRIIIIIIIIINELAVRWAGLGAGWVTARVCIELRANLSPQPTTHADRVRLADATTVQFERRTSSI